MCKKEFPSSERRYYGREDYCSECGAKAELLSLLSRAGIPRKFWGCKHENYIVSNENKTAYDYTLKFPFQDKSGLYLYGPIGTGKTHLASAITRKLFQKNCKYNIKFYSCPYFLDTIRKSYGNEYNNRDEDDVLYEAENSSLLILDDIGSERATDWAIETLFKIINFRYEHCSVTIFTSNLNPDELHNNLGERTVSRIIGMCNCCCVGGSDYRIIQNQKRMDATANPK
jgi:DNA replication protein DnaC